LTRFRFILDNSKYAKAVKNRVGNRLRCIKCGKYLGVGNEVLSRCVGSGGAMHSIKDAYERSTHTVYYDIKCAKELNLLWVLKKE